ncbi:recombinase family protein [Photobacterium sp. DNB23_23_1]
MPMIYSYSRISSVKQKKGTGLAHQKEAIKLEELSQKYDLPISSESFVDDGKSAYHGEHLDGALGRFIDGVKTGQVKPGSILALFSLDRLSRQNIVAAQSLFLKLIESGIRVYSAIDDKLYGEGNSDFTDILLSMVYLERAHNESLHKSNRTKGNALKLIAEHQKGGRSENGLAYAIQSVGTHVWWCLVDPVTREVKEHEVYFDVAKHVCMMILDGYGTGRILDYLNANFPPPATRKNKKSEGWTYASITKIHQNRSLIGERAITIDGQEHTLANYYPPVLSEMEYFRLVDARQSRKRPRGSDKHANFITGIGVARCALCGAPIGSYRNRHGNITYNCLGKTHRKTNCKGWTCAGAHLEREILIHSRLRMSKFRVNKPKDDEIHTLSKQIADTESKIERLVELASLSGDIAQISLKLNECKATKKELEGKLALAQINVAKVDGDLSERWKKVADDALDTSNYEARLEVRELMQRAVNEIKVWPVSAKGHKRSFVAKLVFNDGFEPYSVSFESSNKRYDPYQEEKLTKGKVYNG